MTQFSGTNSVVVGFGSIGSRHVRILKKLGCNVAVVSRRDVGIKDSYSTIADAVRMHNPTYVVIANETALHHDALTRLAETGFKGSVLVEKPLFEGIRPLPNHQFQRLNVAYNLRFHPVIERLRKLLAGQNILSAHGYVGQYLPDWRPGMDYRRSYSSNKELGGGVLLDLSHDLDYLIWLLGNWVHVSALGGHMSSLEISSDDVYTLLIRFTRCPVASIQLNYLDRMGRRRMVINTDEHTYEIDLMQHKILIDKTEEIHSVERDETYSSMHMAMLGNINGVVCTLDEAISVLNLVEEVHQSAALALERTR